MPSAAEMTLTRASIILDSSVEHARWQVWAGGWREATTLRAGARKDKQGLGRRLLAA